MVLGNLHHIFHYFMPPLSLSNSWPIYFYYKYEHINRDRDRETQTYTAVCCSCCSRAYVLRVDYLGLDTYPEGNPEENWFSLTHKALIACSSSRMGRPCKVYPIHISLSSGIATVEFFVKVSTFFKINVCAASL